jgi:hypothetical protein
MIICKKCGGECKPSKTMHTKTLLSEFGSKITTTTFISCQKCIKCGNSFIPEK